MGPMLILLSEPMSDSSCPGLLTHDQEPFIAGGLLVKHRTHELICVTCKCDFVVSIARTKQILIEYFVQHNTLNLE